MATRKHRLFSLILLGLLLSGCAPESTSEDAPVNRETQPNVLIIITDQQSARMMSATGNPYVDTPGMDRLAAEGVRFRRAYVTNPVCLPSRFSMLTGRMPSVIGARSNVTQHLDPVPAAIRQQAMGWRLRAAGYETVYGGKVHLPEGLDAAQAGFEVLTTDERDGLARAVIDYLTEAHEQPFALVASFINPHDICYMGIRDFASSELDQRLLANGQVELARLDRALERPAGVSDAEFFAHHAPPLPPNFEPQEDEPEAIRTLLHRRAFRWKARTQWSNERWREHRWAYARLTEMVDAQVGRVLDGLRSSDYADDTVVIFTSDHGDHDAAHRMEHKSVPYEEAANVPLIIRAPGGMRGHVDEEHLVSTGLDLLPTVCDYAGCTVPEDLEGRSLRPLVERPTVADWRADLVVESEIGPMVVTERYKYLRCDDGANAEQLYDLRADPYETRNVVDDPANRAILEQLRRRFEPVAERWAKVPPHAPPRSQ
jgi:arylsulfatase A-like enzyme